MMDDSRPTDIPFGTRFRRKGTSDDRPHDRLPMIHCGPFAEGGQPYVSGDRWWMYSTPGVLTFAPVYVNENEIELALEPERATGADTEDDR